jgi:hypothetical protein
MERISSMAGGCGSGDEGEEIHEERIYFITTNLGVDDVGGEEEAVEDHSDSNNDGDGDGDCKTRLTHQGNL